MTCHPPKQKKEKKRKEAAAEDTEFEEKDLSRLGEVYESGCEDTAAMLPCSGRRVCWQVLPAKEAALPCV